MDRRNKGMVDLSKEYTSMSMMEVSTYLTPNKWITMPDSQDKDKGPSEKSIQIKSLDNNKMPVKIKAEEASFHFCVVVLAPNKRSRNNKTSNDLLMGLIVDLVDKYCE